MWELWTLVYHVMSKVKFGFVISHQPNTLNKQAYKQTKTEGGWVNETKTSYV